MKTVQKKLEDIKVGDVLVSDSGDQYTITEDVRNYEDFTPFGIDIMINQRNYPYLSDYKHEGIIENSLFNVLDTTEQETKIIEIDGVKYEVTKDEDGWSKPVRVEHKKGDKVMIKDLKAGDRVLVEVEITQSMIDRGDISFYISENHEGFRYVFDEAILNESGAVNANK